MAKDQWAQLVLAAINKIAYSPSNTWDQATNYAGLPDPVTCPGSTWLVLTGTGIWPLNKPSGWYISIGSSWSYLGAYNPVVSGGNVVVTNLPIPASQGDCEAINVSTNGEQILSEDSSRKGFILTAPLGIILIGVGFMPSDSKYSYCMTNGYVVEKDNFTGPVYAAAQDDSKIIYVTEIK